VPYLRGYHPDTIVPGRGYGGDDTAEDVLRLLDAIGAEQAALVGHDWGASISYRAAAAASDRIRAICAIAIPHPRLLKPSPGLLWRARHFLTLRLPTGSRLVRRSDFADIDTLISRWAPRWSAPSATPVCETSSAALPTRASSTPLSPTTGRCRARVYRTCRSRR
jgi:pimeloyl-ACP methyl ester carboxylesterase